MMATVISGFSTACLGYEDVVLEGSSSPLISMNSRMMLFNVSSMTGVSTITNDSSNNPSNY